jgi:type IV secretory pathway TraG/TraD family ATPase VirD4
LDTQSAASAHYAWTHGTGGFLLGYVLLAGFSLLGLKRGRAGARQYFYWPLTSLITLVVTMILASILGRILQSAFKMPLEGLFDWLVGLLCAVAGGYAGGLYWASRGAGLKAATAHARGAMVADGAESQRQVRERQTGVKDNFGASVSLAGIPVPFEDETKHFKLMGTTGAGKSTAMRELLHGALQRGDRAVITDPDGGYLSRFYDPARGDVILNPFDNRSAKWDLFAELKNPYDVDQLASALIPDRPNSDPTWTTHARTLFSDIVRRAQGCVDNLQELHRLLTSAKEEELKILLEGTTSAPLLEEKNARFFGSIHGTMREHIKCLEYVSAQRGESFSVRSWVKSGKGVLFISYRGDQIPALKSIISAWMRLAIVQTLSLEEGDWRLWFMIDELDALGPIDGLPDALVRLRKFGGRCVLGFQTIAQPSTTYGNGPAQAMVENCGTSLLLRCSASEHGGTSGFASRLIGERQVLRVVKSTGQSHTGFMGPSTATRGRSEQHATEYAVMPAEIEQLPDRSGFLKFPSQPAWLRVSFPYYDVPKIAESFLQSS